MVFPFLAFQSVFHYLKGVKFSLVAMARDSKNQIKFTPESPSSRGQTGALKLNSLSFVVCSFMLLLATPFMYLTSLYQFTAILFGQLFKEVKY